MSKLLDNLLIFTAIALLSGVAVILAKRYGHAEGVRAAYEVSLEKCKARYPEYRCRVELERYFDL